MKLRIYSDLHTEFASFTMPPEAGGEEILILAGDIAVGMAARNDIEKWSRRFRAVIYVFGNHEFYNQNHDKLIERMRQFSATIDNFHFLEKDSVVIDGVQFLGTTLWTDLNDYAPEVVAMAEYFMNDYRQIRWEDGPGYNQRKAIYLTPEHTYALHKESVEWLSRQDWSMPTVVITHHTPHEMFLNLDRYGKDELNYAYFTDLSEQIKKWKPCIWVAGHTHKRVESMLHDTLMFSNPRGYIGYDPVIDFARNRVLKLDERTIKSCQRVRNTD